MLGEVTKADKNILDTEQTRGMITSLWLIAENIGGWLGSFLGGVAYDNLGFESGSLLIIGLQGIIVLGIPYVWYRTKCNHNKRLVEMLSKKDLSTNQNGISSERIGPIIKIETEDERTPLIGKM